VDIGIGLPTTIPGTEGRTLVDWARHAEEAGFSTLGTIGRLVYPNYEELIALSAAAAVTSRIRLTTSVLLAPFYTNSALLAKQAASLDRLSGGRLVLGMAVGGREDDFTASGVSMSGRGHRLEEQVALMKRIWSGEEFGTAGGIGPEPARSGGPQIILGGSSEASFRRVARIADGWIMGAMSPSQAEGYLLHYYAWLGDIANMIAGSAAVSPEMVKSYVAAFEASGCDEIIWVPTAARLDQVSLLAEAIA